jgi:4a-hydroxytetrahydrobiopterin dehydratase
VAAAIAKRSSDVAKLNPDQVKARTAALPGWQIEGGELVKTFAFKDFVAALGFVNRVGQAAESAGHHPDIDIRYNRVRLALVTHDAGGLTDKDFQLASQVEKLA